MIPSSSITMGKSTTFQSNRDIRGPIPYQRRTFRPKTSKWLIKVSISSFQRTLIRRISPRWRILPWCRREGDFTGRFAPRPAGRRAERGAPLSDETKAAPETAQSWLSIPPLDVKFPADGSSWRVSSTPSSRHLLPGFFQVFSTRSSLQNYCSVVFLVSFNRK